MVWARKNLTLFSSRKTSWTDKKKVNWTINKKKFWIFRWYAWTVTFSKSLFIGCYNTQCLVMCYDLCHALPVCPFNPSMIDFLKYSKGWINKCNCSHIFLHWRVGKGGFKTIRFKLLGVMHDISYHMNQSCPFECYH